MNNGNDRTVDRSLFTENEVFYDLLVSKVSEESLEKLEKKSALIRNTLIAGAAVGVTILVVVFQMAVDQIGKRVDDALKTSNSIIEEKERVILESADRISKEVAREAAREIAEEIARNTMQKLVENTINESVEKAEEAWEHLILYSKLESFSNKLESDDGFTEIEALEILDILKKIKKSKSYQSEELFPKLLEDVIDIFQAADRDDLVQKIEPLFGDIMLSEDGIIFTMLQALGITLIGSAAPPSITTHGNAAEKWKETYDRFKGYSKSRSPSIRPLVAIYISLISFVSSDESEVVKGGILELSHLDKIQKQTVEEALYLLISEGWVRGSTGESQRVKQRTLEFLEHYRVVDETGTLTNVYRKWLVILYSKLESFSNKLESDDGFTEIEALEILDILKKIKKSKSYQSEELFPKLLEDVIDIFQAADRDDLVQKIEPLFGDIMLSE